MDGVITRRHQ